MNDNIYQSELLFQNQRIQELEKELNTLRKAYKLAVNDIVAIDAKYNFPFHSDYEHWETVYLKKARTET